MKMVLAITTFPSTTFKHDRPNSSIMISTISKIRSFSFNVNYSSVVAVALPTRNTSNAIDTGSSFTWDDVFQISQSRNVSSDLSGFFKKIDLCNRGWLYPVTSSYGGQVYFLLERAAAPYFGIKAYGVIMNGYVERDGQKHLWVGKRSEVKPTHPGMLDHLVAGGLSYGISCGENLVKECKEEAGIPNSLSSRAIPVGVVSYTDIDGCRFKRDVLFCYDLKLPETFIPSNQDGEVGSFRLLPITLVVDIIQSTLFFRSNCNLVIIHFLFHHGYIKPGDVGYLKLLQSLTSGDCS